MDAESITWQALAITFQAGGILDRIDAAYAVPVWLYSFFTVLLFHPETKNVSLEQMRLRM